MRFRGRMRGRAERGQALLEAAIVLPITIFLVLGALQLVMLEHARIMTEYAAYNAARAGIVHSANWNVMRNAAMVAALPLYERTDRVDRLLVAWGKIKVLSEATELVDTATGTLEHIAGDLLGVDVSGLLPDVSLVEVEVTSPKERDFRRGFEWQDRRVAEQEQIDPRGELAYPERELDFDDREMIAEDPRLGRLAVEVRVLYPMNIPIVNWIFFQLWYAQSELRTATLRASLSEWAQLQARIEQGDSAGMTLEQVVRNTDGEQWSDDFFLTQQRTKEARLLRDLALSRAHVYMIPLRASYAMQMQSNPYYENRRQPVWFSLSD
jgi:hypothetical protein